MKKEKLRGIILGATISAAIFIPKDNAYAAELDTKGTVQNVSSFLRIREGASTNSAIVGALRNDEEVDIKGKTGDWYNIQHGNVSGYVYDEYIKVTADKSARAVTASTGKTGYVTNVSTSLRLRQGPSTSTNVIDYLREGQALKIEGQESNWYKVYVNGKLGYVSKDYVKVSGGSSTSSSSSGNSQSSSNSESTQSYASKNAVLQNVSSSLRLRSSASTSGSVLGYIYPGTNFKVIGESGSWYHVDVNGQKGYASKEYVKISSGNSSSSSSGSNGSSSNNSNNNTNTGSSSSESHVSKNGTLQNVSSSLRLRSTPSTSGSVIGSIYPGSVFKIIGETGSWYHVSVDGKNGYASKAYIKIVSQSTSNNTNTGSSQHASSTYQKVLSIMKQQIGAPYVWGGAGEQLTTSLINRLKAEFPSQASAGKYAKAEQEVGKGYRAFDCSGLMQWAFGQAGVSIGRSTYSQINDGVSVSVSQAKPGDLLFYKGLGHVGMYIGNGQWIESPNPHACVRITNVPWNSIGSARRVL